MNEVMMSEQSNFRFTFLSLWFRLVGLAIITLVFPLLLYLGKSRIQSWTFYLKPHEIVFEVLVRVVVAALAGIVIGTFVTLLAGPFLLGKSRQRVEEWVSKIAIGLVVFLLAKCALNGLIQWSYSFGGHRAIFDLLLIYGYEAAFVVALFIPRTREAILSSIDVLVSRGMTRFMVVATIAVAVILAIAEFSLGKTPQVVRAASARPKSNIVLVTFDALSAEDVSSYGRQLPTTPNIDAFARTGTVFDHFYSTSTFTTPSISTIVTGLYPSESDVHQLQGSVRGKLKGKNLAELMRAAGYETGAFISNPFPYYYVKSLNAFDVLPEPEFRQGLQAKLWALTAPLHQNSGIGSRVDEYMELEALCDTWGSLPKNQSLRYRPAASFEQAKEILSQLPEGFFLWVHVLAPHDPYIPDVADQGRFVPQPELESFLKEGRRFQPTYKAEEQSLVDRRRLAYDEYVASADRAFGDFMKDFEKNEKSQNTIIIVSADHGESFQGGIYRHETPYLTRPVIHIPLIVHMPGQQTSRKVEVTADESSLDPTILELAGSRKPEWMPGESLVKWLDGNSSGAGEGRAFTQYLEKNSDFKPLHHGMVGMIDAQDEYVLDLDTGKGELKPLDQAEIWNVDRTSDNPARAAEMRSAIFAKFPELPH